MNTELQDQLQAAFGFSAQDLQLNRDGQLTPEQSHRLQDEMFPFWKIIGITVIVVLIGTVLAVPGIAFSTDMFVGLEVLPAAFAIIALLAVVFLGIVFRLRRKVYANIREGKVTTLEGRLKVKRAATDEGGGRFEIREKTFNDLTPEQFDVLKHISQAYNRPKVTVYHVPEHYKVASMEIATDSVKDK